MVSAIWSMPPYEASEMPLRFFLKFFQNHGLFKLKNRPQWFTVSNRSKTYVNKILSKISGEHYKNYKIYNDVCFPNVLLGITINGWKQNNQQQKITLWRF